MDDTYKTLKKVLDNTNELLNELYLELVLNALYLEHVPNNKVNESLWVASKLEPEPTIIPVFSFSEKVGNAEVVDGHIRVYIDPVSAWPQ